MGILEVPGLGRAEEPGSREPTGGMDDLTAPGRTRDLATVSAGVDAARDLRVAVSRFEGEVGAIDILPGTALAVGFGRPPTVEAIGRARRLVWAASPPNALDAVVGAEGRVSPGRASVVGTVRAEVGGNDDLIGGGGAAIEVGLKLAGRAGGPILPGIVREAGPARARAGTAGTAVLADPARGIGAREGGGIIDRAEVVVAVGLAAGSAVLDPASARGLVKPVLCWALMISAGCMALRVLSLCAMGFGSSSLG